MKRLKRLPEERDLRDRWMVSYADFITLLFGFFVVMYAVSSLDVVKFQSVSQGVKSAFSDDAGAQPILLELARIGGATPTDDPDTMNQVESDAVSPQYAAVRDRLNGSLGRVLEKQDFEEAVHMRATERGFVVSLATQSFFEAGQALLNDRGQRAMDGLGKVLETVHGQIRIEGHTDDRPIASKRYPSNWELSTERATMVLRYLLKHFEIRPERVSAAGYASYRPLAPNDNDTNRARNRRVDIVILSPWEAAQEAGANSDQEVLNHLLDQLPPVPED